MPSVKIKSFISLGLMVFAMNCTAGLFSPSNFDECVIDGAKEAKTEAAVGLVYQACKRKFPESNSIEKSSALKPPMICSIYWNGWRFIKGKVNSTDYSTFSLARYNVEVVEVQMPKAMASELGLDLPAEKIDLYKGKAGEFMNGQWQKIIELCDLR